MVHQHGGNKLGLINLFKRLEDRPFTFIIPGGNQGDEMIWAGARKLADAVGLNYREVPMKRGHNPYLTIEEDEIIYLNGGGGFNTWWNWTPKLLHRLVEQYPENGIIVGPSTVALQGWYLDKWLPDTKRVIFYAREHTTYNYLKNRNMKLRLDHDTALHLTKWSDELLNLLECESIPPFKLAAIREDPESPDTLPESINLEDYDVVIDPCQTKKWAQLHVYASEILTNRSHSAILGAILGKKTKMFKGKYHKNRSIWKYSLKSRGVKWVE